MKVVELFSGIGSQKKALKRLENRFNRNINVIRTCEWNIHAIVAYDLINNQKHSKAKKQKKEELIANLSQLSLSIDGNKPLKLSYLKSLNKEILQSIYDSIVRNNNLIDITSVKGSDIPNDTNLLTYSFPCQDLSNVGSFHGYNSGIDRNIPSRSGLLWEVERILLEKNKANEPLPKFLLLENVTTLMAKRHSHNFNEWKQKLIDLGYINKVYTLNALKFGIPQHRNRVLMLSVFVGNNTKKMKLINKYFNENNLENENYRKKLAINAIDLKDILKLDYNNPKYLKEALLSQPNDTESRKKIWEKNSVLFSEDNKISKYSQTITTKQDRHPNSGNIYFNPNNNKSRYRFLTPRECFLLMGFDESDFNVLINNNHITRGNSQFFSRDVLYRLAGNSIVVNVLEAVFTQMFEIDELLK